MIKQELTLDRGHNTLYLCNSISLDKLNTSEKWFELSNIKTKIYQPKNWLVNSYKKNILLWVIHQSTQHKKIKIGILKLPGLVYLKIE